MTTMLKLCLCWFSGPCNYALSNRHMSCMTQSLRQATCFWSHLHLMRCVCDTSKWTPPRPYGVVHSRLYACMFVCGETLVTEHRLHLMRWSIHVCVCVHVCLDTSAGCQLHLIRWTIHVCVCGGMGDTNNLCQSVIMSSHCFAQLAWSRSCRNMLGHDAFTFPLTTWTCRWTDRSSTQYNSPGKQIKILENVSF